MPLSGREVTISGRPGSALEQIERELYRDPRLQSAHTRRAYLSDLRAFELWRANAAMTKGLVEDYAVYLRSQDRSPNSINRSLAAVRWWARRLADLVYEEPLPKAQRDEIVLQAARVAAVHDIKGERALRGRHIATSEFQALLEACRRDGTPAGRRDGALFALAWTTGMRRSEIASLRLDDIKSVDDAQVISVRGKGNKVRQAYVYAAVEWLNQWLTARGRDRGPLFCRVFKGGKIGRGKRLTEDGLGKILAKRSLEAALAEPMTWHDFRRTFAGNLLDNGNDLATVQKLLGHTSPTTTSNYDRRGEQTRQRAIRTIYLPLKPDSD